jgi:hemoglobin/transferrin/lactoferrin receptor protein
VIRGQRGLRVLFLEDGLRLNNARRQTDFGEVSGLVDLDGIAAVEIVRGPASVLYGSDAIGGVLNLIPKRPSLGDGSRLDGFADLRWGSAADSTRGAASLSARLGRIDLQLGGSARSTDDYEAPAGRFGDLRLADDTAVLDTALEDRSLWGGLALGLSDGHWLRLRAERYRAEQAGFGLVPAAAYGAEESAVIRILYPYQDFDRLTLGYEGSALGLAVADSVDAKLYWQRNERALVNDIDIDIGPLGPGFPSSSVEADTENLTELETLGVRLESIRAAGARHLLTWGIEAFRDDSFNTDSSVTTTILRFPFPPFERRIVSGDDVANAPNARNESAGAFVQDEVALGERLKLTGGLRWQRVETRAEATPGWDVAGLDFEDDQLVGALSGAFQLSETVNLYASYGTAFRAPSIVERLFNGLTPEGSGFQLLNPELSSETSENVDLGVKYRDRDVFAELTVFRTEVEDGIVQYFLADGEIAALPADVRAEIEAARVDFVVQQRNAERLRYEGVELALGYRFAGGVAVGGNATWLDSDRLDSANPPTGDSYGEKYVAWARWQPSSGRFWTEYRVRHNGSTDLELAAAEPVPPFGPRLPSFTVHTVAGGVTLLERAGLRHELQLAIENLTDELYAEFANASFFRPEPGRNVKASYRVRF